MTEHDIELAKQAGFDVYSNRVFLNENLYMIDVDDQLAKFAELIRADKQGEAVGFIESALSGSVINPDIKATLYAKYAIGENKLKEGAELYTSPPDLSEEITKLKNILRLRRSLFDARESRLREALKNCAESLKGYRREMNDHQPCDAEKIAIEILENT